MVSTVAATIIESLVALGPKAVWGVVGDALNPLTDAMRHEDRLERMGVRHEEVAALAAGSRGCLTRGRSPQRGGEGYGPRWNGR